LQAAGVSAEPRRPLLLLVLTATPTVVVEAQVTWGVGVAIAVDQGDRWEIEGARGSLEISGAAEGHWIAWAAACSETWDEQVFRCQGTAAYYHPQPRMSPYRTGPQTVYR